MIEETRKVYRCEFCKKPYLTKKGAGNHEQSCKKNPDNFRACFGCDFLGEKRIEYYEDDPMGGERCSIRKVLFCSKIEQPVYPPKVERKKNWFDFGDYINQPMKKECSMRKDPWEDELLPI